MGARKREGIRTKMGFEGRTRNSIPHRGSGWQVQAHGAPGSRFPSSELAVLAKAFQPKQGFFLNPERAAEKAKVLPWVPQLLSLPGMELLQVLAGVCPSSPEAWRGGEALNSPCLNHSLHKCMVHSREDCDRASRFTELAVVVYKPWLSVSCEPSQLWPIQQRHGVTSM